LLNSGRWNTAGLPVTYCATVPSLAALEKRVHVTDPSLLPPLMMVEYDAPDDRPEQVIDIAQLSPDWTLCEVDTQRIGDHWLDGMSETLLVDCND
jgi:RES domain-containing protein